MYEKKKMDVNICISGVLCLEKIDGLYKLLHFIKIKVAKFMSVVFTSK